MILAGDVGGTKVDLALYDVSCKAGIEADCAEREKIRGIIHQLFDLYMASDEALFEGTGFVPPDLKTRAREVCDYIAGMTDRFARNQYLKHFLPSGFLGVEGF